MLYTLMNYVFWGIAIAALIMSIWALVHAMRTPAQAFAVAGKLAKKWWLLITAGATFFTLVAASGYMGLGLGQLNIFTIASVIGSGIYLADVRPAVTGFQGGKGGNNGPYGPW